MLKKVTIKKVISLLCISAMLTMTFASTASAWCYIHGEGYESYSTKYCNGNLHHTETLDCFAAGKIFEGEIHSSGCKIIRYFYDTYAKCAFTGCNVGWFAGNHMHYVEHTGAWLDAVLCPY